MTFEEWKSSVFSHNCSDEYMQGFEDGSELAWNASAEAYKPRWIPVSERLPDKEEIYPVLMEGCNWWFTRRFENDKFQCNENESPTYWLELPEMPE